MYTGIFSLYFSCSFITDFVEQRGTKRTVTDTVTVTDTDTVVSVSEDTDTIEQARTAPEGAAQPAHENERVYYKDYGCYKTILDDDGNEVIPLDQLDDTFV